MSYPPTHTHMQEREYSTKYIVPKYIVGSEHYTDDIVRTKHLIDQVVVSIFFKIIKRTNECVGVCTQARNKKNDN